MNKIQKFILFVFISFSPFSFAQSNINDGLSAITISAIKGQMEFLASDWMEGRQTGEKGCYMAADYIASVFQILGIEPAGDIKWTQPSWEERNRGIKPEQYRTYFQNFDLISYEATDEQIFMLNSNSKKMAYNYKTDFSVNTGTIGIEVDAPLVFVGYGFKDENNKYNDFDGVDVKGKIIVRLAGYPGHKDTNSIGYKKFTPKDRYGIYNINQNKNKIAGELGAVAIIEINLDEDITVEWSENISKRYKTPYYEGAKNPMEKTWTRMTIPGDNIQSSLTTINVSKRLANEIISGTNIDFSTFENEVKNSLNPNSKVIPNKSVYLKTSVKTKLVEVQNVLGMIEGENPDEIVVIGGHYDHMGIHNDFIWNGADDNASGSVGVMTIAKAVKNMNVKPKRTIIFALWTGEEKGLLGSRYYVHSLKDDVKKVVAYLNYDMISRDSPTDSLGRECSMIYTKAYSKFEEMTKNNVQNYDLKLDVRYRPSENPRGGSDHTPFSEKDVPIFYFMAGFHDEYHTPVDEVNKVNYYKMAEIIKVGFLNIWEIANFPDNFRLLKNTN